MTKSAEGNRKFRIQIFFLVLLGKNLLINLIRILFVHSSSRSIKRKRFDDEIVEYSLNLLPPAQLNRFGRARTQSQTYFNAFPDASLASGAAMSPSLLPPNTLTSMGGSVQPLPPPSIVSSTIASPLPHPLQTAQQPSSVYMPTITTNSLPAPTLATVSQQAPTSIPPQSQVPVAPIPVHTEKRRVTKGNATGGGGSSKKSKKNRGGHQTSTKDLGRWKPIDDLALIIGIQQTNDLRMVHRGTKFSCKFTVQEMQSRWYSLLYEESISRISIAAMRNLHPELVESVQSKALYSTLEEEVLGNIKSVTIQSFTITKPEIQTLYFSDRESRH